MIRMNPLKLTKYDPPEYRFGYEPGKGLNYWRYVVNEDGKRRIREKFEDESVARGVIDEFETAFAPAWMVGTAPMKVSVYRNGRSFTLGVVGAVEDYEPGGMLVLLVKGLVTHQETGVCPMKDYPRIAHVERQVRAAENRKQQIVRAHAPFLHPELVECLWENGFRTERAMADAVLDERMMRNIRGTWIYGKYWKAYSDWALPQVSAYPDWLKRAKEEEKRKAEEWNLWYDFEEKHKLSTRASNCLRNHFKRVKGSGYIPTVEDVRKEIESGRLHCKPSRKTSVRQYGKKTHAEVCKAFGVKNRDYGDGELKMDYVSRIKRDRDRLKDCVELLMSGEGVPEDVQKQVRVSLEKLEA